MLSIQRPALYSKTFIDAGLLLDGL